MHRLSKYTLRHEEFLYKSCFFWQHLSSKMIALLIRSETADKDGVTQLQCPWVSARGRCSLC